MDHVRHNMETRQQLVVVMYCRKGRHRSVSIACLLHQPLARATWDSRLWHSMRDFWDLGTCGKCPECAPVTPEKLMILENALRMFGDV